MTRLASLLAALAACALAGAAHANLLVPKDVPLPGGEQVDQRDCTVSIFTAV